AALPATILGAESEPAPLGILEKIYYRDGEAADAVASPPIELPALDTVREVVAAALPAVDDAVPAVADLSDIASEITSALPPLDLGYLGQSYGDAPDGGPSMLNALHLM